MAELPLGLYEHYKGNPYEVTGIAIHTETMEKLVVYKSLYESNYPYGSTWVRPLSMFVEKVEINGELIPRFKYVGSGG
jgi:hypothetical protein